MSVPQLSRKHQPVSVSRPELRILNEFSSAIVDAAPHGSDPDSGLVPQYILISSEHYFRLAHEAYQQLQAVHFRASLEFSLAEWLHIHALLLYGRIQAVQQAAGSLRTEHDITNQLNQIDLTGEVPVFGPIATALGAIGIVEDRGSGVVYIPDAIFPSQPSNSFDTSFGSDPLTELSSLEIRQILDGTLYDWQRSWHRVLEARTERARQEVGRGMTRSSSELISAIRETTQSISQMRCGQMSPLLDEESTSEDSSLETRTSDLMSFENQLTALIEEARNARDYTIHRPCDQVYEKRIRNSLLALMPMENRQTQQHVRYQPAPEAHTHLPNDHEELARENEERVECKEDEEHEKPVEPNEAGEDHELELTEASMPSIPVSIDSPKLPVALDMDESFMNSVSSLGLAESPPHPSSISSINSAGSAGKVNRYVTTAELESQFGSLSAKTVEGLAKQPESDEGRSAQPRYCVLPLPVNVHDAQDSTSPLPRNQPENPSVSNSQNSSPAAESNPTAESNSAVEPNPDLSSSPPRTQSTPRTRSALRRSPRLRNAPVVATDQPKPRVQIGSGLSDATSFVQYDSQLWRGYTKFVERLQEKQLADFEPLKKSTDGSHAWVIKIRVPSRHHQSPDRRPRLVMPRRSISPQDQVLALLLQTSHPRQSQVQDWHVESVADVDLPKLLSTYIQTAVNDRLI